MHEITVYIKNNYTNVGLIPFSSIADLFFFPLKVFFKEQYCLSDIRSIEDKRVPIKIA